MGLYVLGLDGGGTKTLAQAMNAEGTPLFRVGGGALNLNSETPDRVRAVVRDILQQAGRQAGGPPAAVCIAAAGVSNPAAAQVLRAGAQDAGYAGPGQVTGDHMAALAGALGRPEGLILSAGTGSICAGRTADGREARSGGFGHLIDDEGSGYAMGRDVLRAVIEAWDGRGPETCLTKQVCETLNVQDAAGIVAFEAIDRRTGGSFLINNDILYCRAECGFDGGYVFAVNRDERRKRAVYLSTVDFSLGI